MIAGSRRRTLATFARLVGPVALIITVDGCGGAPPAPTQPTTPTPAPITPAGTVASIRVGTAGNVPTTLSPGDTLQLFAQATNSDGTTADVTNLAVWQSSDPVVATVSPTGLLTAAIEGALDVSASYSGKSGSIHADIQKPGCKATLSPASLVFGALSSGGTVTVTTSLTTCRWTARSDASWLSFQYDPGRSGSGSFSYAVPGNNNVNARDANIIVSVDGGAAAIHAVHQERPLGCVCTVAPEQLTFSRSSGGRGSFTVTTVPADCEWRITDSYSDVPSVSPRTAVGAATVTYTVSANSFAFDHTLRLQGLSGLNPPGMHTIRVQ